MALCVLAAACAPDATAPPPAAAPLSYEADSARGLYRVQVQPRAGAMPLATFHDWTIRVRDADARPVHPARIAVTGGMPGHGHGLPSQPQVTEHLGDGVYRIEGMNFSMPGDWVLVFAIESAAGADEAQVEFELTL